MKLYSILLIFSILYTFNGQKTGNEVEKCYNVIEDSLIKLQEKLKILQDVSTKATYSDLTRKIITQINQLIQRGKFIENVDLIGKIKPDTNLTNNLINKCDGNIETIGKIALNFKKEVDKFLDISEQINKVSLKSKIELFRKTKKECSEAESELNELNNTITELLKKINSFNTIGKQYNINLQAVNKTKTDVESLKLPENLVSQYVCKSKLSELLSSNIKALNNNKKLLKDIIENLNKKIKKSSNIDIKELQEVIEDFNKRVITENSQLKKIKIPEINAENIKIMKRIKIPEISIENVKIQNDKIKQKIEKFKEESSLLAELNEFLKVAISPKKIAAIQKEIEDYKHLVSVINNTENFENIRDEVENIKKINTTLADIFKHDKTDIEEHTK